MNKENKKIVKVAGVYTAVILGAGFASGQEIINFFVNYGKSGFLGLVMASLLFAVVGWAVLHICHMHKINSCQDFMDLVIGKKIGKIMEVVLGLFMFILFSTMLAASGATLKEAFQMNFSTGVFLVAGACFISFLFGMEGIVAINAFLSPVMVIGCVIVGLYTFFTNIVPVFNPALGPSDAVFMKEGGPWFLSAIIYVSYNIITAITVLSSLDRKNNTAKTAKKAAYLSGFIMCLLGFSIALPLYLNYNTVFGLEIPLLALLHKNATFMEYLYIIVLLSAVFSSAATNGYAVIQWISARFHFPAAAVRVVITLLGIMTAYAGFSNFVSKVYPVFGVVGFMEILLILLFLVRRR